MVEENLPLVQWALRKLYRGPLLSRWFDDLYQEAVIGLMRAVEKWDPTRGPFSVYAYTYIQGHARKFLIDKANLIRIPASISGADRAAERIRLKTMPIINNDNSKDRIQGRREDDTHRPFSLDMEEALAALPSCEREIIHTAFVSGKNRSQIGAEVDYHRERVRQLEEGALEALASDPRVCDLADVPTRREAMEPPADPAVVARLPDEERAVYKARYVRRESIAATAAALGMTLNRLRRVEERALARLNGSLPLDHPAEPAVRDADRAKPKRKAVPLPEDVRWVYEAAREGLTVEDIAADLGFTVPRVKRLLAAALAILGGEAEG